MNKEQIPFHYKIPVGSIEFESKLMKIFYLGLKVHLNPSDRLHKEKLIKKINSNRISMEMKWEEIIQNTDDSDKNTLLRIFDELHENGDNLKYLLKGLKKNTTINDDNEKSMFFNDIKNLEEHWNKYSKQTDKKSILQFKNSMVLGHTLPSMQKKGVTLSTVHTMKGQEFDIIFLMGMDEGTFPDYRALQKGGDELIQEKNNLYVAFTRSRRFLYISYPLNRKMPWGTERSRERSSFLNGLYE